MRIVRGIDVSFFTTSLRPLLLIPCLAASGCLFETPSSSFADRADAEHGELFRKGWLPEWIPPSAKRIREKHDIDSNATLIRFAFSPPDHPPFGKACVETTHEALEFTRLDAYWWPTHDVLARMPHVYHCPLDSGYLAIPAEVGLAYFWRTRA